MVWHIVYRKIVLVFLCKLHSHNYKNLPCALKIPVCINKGINSRFELSLSCIMLLHLSQYSSPFFMRITPLISLERSVISVLPFFDPQNEIFDVERHLK